MELSREEVRRRLSTYYDIPKMIADETAAMLHCEDQIRINEFAPCSPRLTGLPGGRGMPGDPTGQAAVGQNAYYREEISRCRQRITQLKRQQLWTLSALDTLERVDRRILELSVIGPADPRSRAGWRHAPWKAIAREVGYSESQARRKFPVILETMREHA